MKKPSLLEFMKIFILRVTFFEKLLTEERMEKFQFNILIKNLEYEFIPAN